MNSSVSGGGDAPDTLACTIDPGGACGPDPALGALGGGQSKVWVGHYGEYERFLRTAVIDRARGTTQRVFFTPGGLAESVAVHREDYKGEIAGYKFDRVLNLDMVPPTVEKNVDGVAVALALWVLNTRPLRRIDEGGAGRSDPARWNYQLHRAYAFEDLVANLDVEHEASHSEAFTTTLAQPFEIGTKLNQIDRRFFNRIKALDNRTVTRAIGDLVDARAIEALFTRRDAMVKAFEKLAAQKGATQVFTPGRP